MSHRPLEIDNRLVSASQSDIAISVARQMSHGYKDSQFTLVNERTYRLLAWSRQWLLMDSGDSYVHDMEF